MIAASQAILNLYGDVIVQQYKNLKEGAMMSEKTVLDFPHRTGSVGGTAVRLWRGESKRIFREDDILL